MPGGMLPECVGVVAVVVVGVAGQQPWLVAADVNVAASESVVVDGAGVVGGVVVGLPPAEYASSVVVVAAAVVAADVVVVAGLPGYIHPETLILTDQIIND